MAFFGDLLWAFSAFAQKLQKLLRDSDPKVREAAVRDLPTAEQVQLCEIALADENAKVRMAAAAKIIDRELLGHLSKHKDAAVAKYAQEQLSHHKMNTIRQKPYAQVKDALASVNDSTALSDIALHADHQDTRQAAFDKICQLSEPSEHQLSTLAIQEETGAYGTKLVPQIEKRQLLKNIAKAAKAESVRTLAQQKIDELAQTEKQPSKERQRKRQAKQLLALVDRARTAAVSSKWEASEHSYC